MSPLVVYVVVIAAACAAAGVSAERTIDCYDSKGRPLQLPPTTEPFKCRPWCPPGCPPGGCIRYNKCDCGPGYKDMRTRAQVKAKEAVHCEPHCKYGCAGGDCVPPGECKCWEGYMKDPNRVNTCVWGD